jgi:hypothetical protein
MVRAAEVLRAIEIRHCLQTSGILGRPGNPR